MKSQKAVDLIPIEIVQNRIFLIRGKKVMLDRDLAELYGVQTKVLNQAVKRNGQRFPEDFLIKLTKSEKQELVTNCDRFSTLKHSSVLPFAFTENGISMLSSVLNCERAIQVNIQIMRTFTKMRELIGFHKELLQRLNKIELKQLNHDKDIIRIFDVIKQLMSLPVTIKSKQKKIGFKKE